MYLRNQIINLECVRHVDVNQFKGLHAANAFLLSENLTYAHKEPTIYRINPNKPPRSVAS